MGIVAFDAAAFVARYPEFSTVSLPLLQAYFAEATLHMNNSDASPVSEIGQRAVLLNMIVAHLAQIYSGPNGNGAQGIVGRIADAAEGSVNVSAEYSTTVTQSEAYWIQTKYGAAWWQATAVYRTAHYISRRPLCGPFFFR